MKIVRVKKHMGHTVTIQMSAGELLHMRQIVLLWREINPDLSFYKERCVASKFLNSTMEPNDADYREE